MNNSKDDFKEETNEEKWNFGGQSSNSHDDDDDDLNYQENEGNCGSDNVVTEKTFFLN